MSANIDKLLDFLYKPSKGFNVVVMPDFFMDRVGIDDDAIQIEDQRQSVCEAGNRVHR